MSSILSQLNPPQQEAVLSTEGPVLILAGAGSGKTRALTHRIAYMVGEKGIAPWHILAITFTNKAAGEMKERVERLTGGSGVFVSTFHAACARLLRADADRLGYTRNFAIYDTEDQKALMRRILKAMDLDPRMYREREILARISSLKNELVSAEEFARISGGRYREEKIASVYTEYQKQLVLADAMDFDDLLVNTVILLRDDPDVLERTRDRFRYILVDEYQDTNEAQFRILEMLAREHRNLCVVGDDDQSIYKFRGANVKNILNFEKVFPEAKVIRLEQNYRSTGYILKAANAVIAHNEGRKEKTLWTSRPDGEKPEFWSFETAQEEARAVVRDIREGRRRFPYGDTAVLYRTNSQSRILEERFVEDGVPYRLIGGTNFYQRKEIKDILAYLRVIASGTDEVAVRRIINVPRRGIGDTTIRQIAETAEAKGIRFFEAVAAAEEDPALRRSAGRLGEFRKLIEDLREDAKHLRVWQLVEQVVLRSGYEAEIRREDTPDQAEARMENIRELENKAAGLEDEAGDPTALERFLEEVALVAEVDALPGDNDRVVLMTLHSAKGLEFGRVYITGMEQGLFPGNKALCSGDESDLEEERRLCYVGFTRAKEKLILTAARTRMINGETQYRDFSQFIEEIPPELLIRKGGAMRGAAEGRARQWEREERFGYFRREDIPGAGRRETPGGNAAARPVSPAGWKDFGESFAFGSFGKKPAPAPKRPSGGAFPEDGGEEPADPAELKPGDRVKSARFGEGTVVLTEQDRRDYKVTVDFDRAGRKVMLASFAGLIRCREPL